MRTPSSASTMIASMGPPVDEAAGTVGRVERKGREYTSCGRGACPQGRRTACGNVRPGRVPFGRSEETQTPMFGKRASRSENIMILGLGGVGYYLTRRLARDGTPSPPWRWIRG